MSCGSLLLWLRTGTPLFASMSGFSQRCGAQLGGGEEAEITAPLLPSTINSSGWPGTHFNQQSPRNKQKLLQATAQQRNCLSFNSLSLIFTSKTSLLFQFTAEFLPESWLPRQEERKEQTAFYLTCGCPGRMVLATQDVSLLRFCSAFLSGEKIST